MGRLPERLWPRPIGPHDLDPLALATNLVAGIARYHARDYTGSIARFRAHLELDPRSSLPHGTLWLCLNLQGRHDEAVVEYVKVLESYRRRPEQSAAFHRAYRYRGIRGCWQWLIDDRGVTLTGRPNQRALLFRHLPFPVWGRATKPSRN